MRNSNLVASSIRPGMHLEAKAIVSSAMPGITPAQSLVLRSVGWLESNYGRGWRNAGVDSKNWGAITAGTPENEECPAGSFAHGDSRRDLKTGQLIKYVTCFKVYETDDDAARDLAKVLFKPNVIDAINSGNIRSVSEAMRVNRYYLGTAPTLEQQIDEHANRMQSSITSITRETGESNPFNSTIVVPPINDTSKVAKSNLIFPVLMIGAILLLRKKRK